MMVDKDLASLTCPPVLAHRINKKKDFVGYTQEALKKFGESPEALSPEVIQDYYRRYKTAGADRRIMVLWTLRALLAPVLESLILVDRWLYLKQATSNSRPGAGVWMYPLFDPRDSPRNVVFVAKK